MSDRWPFIRTLIEIQIKRLPVKTVLDIGAYFGGASIYLAEQFPHLDVHAIEPQPAACVELRERTGKLDNYFIHEIALSDTTEAAMFDGQLSTSASFTNSGIVVQCETLASFMGIFKQPDVLLFNCEGSEYSIFEHPWSLDIIAKSRLIDLSMHGKTFEFLGETYARKRLEINRWLENSGFITVYGEPLKDVHHRMNGHLRQVWIRE